MSCFLLSIISSIYFSSCSSSHENSDKEDSSVSVNSGVNTKTNLKESEGIRIINFAKEEQKSKMYSPYVDSTYLYWIDSELVILNGSTKCNIFALNVLYKAGFKTPEENALAGDLFDTTLFSEILPVVAVNEISDAKKGDLIVWENHVIIFESVLEIENDLYAKGYWAGTGQENNGDNIINNVCYGKYKLNGDYIVRRPVKK